VIVGRDEEDIGDEGAVGDGCGGEVARFGCGYVECVEVGAAFGGVLFALRDEGERVGVVHPCGALGGLGKAGDSLLV